MPIDPVTGSLIVAGLAGASQAGNVVAQGKMNKKTRQWNEKMYAQQKADNEAQWHMQNEYNSPSSQMARLREAGLNPNLVYGNGADATAQSINSASPASWNPKAPEIELGRMAQGGLSTYYDVQLKQAQTDNVKANTTVLNQDAILKGQQTANAEMDYYDKNFTLGQKQAVNEYFIDATKANLQKLQIETSYLDKEKSLGVQQQMAQLAHTQESKKAIEKDNQLRDLDIWLRSSGISPNDPMLMRMIAQGAKAIANGKSISDFVSDIKNGLSGRKK